MAVLIETGQDKIFRCLWREVRGDGTCLLLCSMCMLFCCRGSPYFLRHPYYDYSERKPCLYKNNACTFLAFRHKALTPDGFLAADSHPSDSSTTGMPTSMSRGGPSPVDVGGVSANGCSMSYCACRAADSSNIVIVTAETVGCPPKLDGNAGSIGVLRWVYIVPYKKAMLNIHVRGRLLHLAMIQKIASNCVATSLDTDRRRTTVSGSTSIALEARWPSNVDRSRHDSFPESGGYTSWLQNEQLFCRHRRQ